MRDVILAFGGGNCNDVSTLARCRSGSTGTRRELIVKFVGQRLDCEEDSDEPTVLAKIKQEGIITFESDHHFHLESSWRRDWLVWLHSCANPRHDSSSSSSLPVLSSADAMDAMEYNCRTCDLL